MEFIFLRVSEAVKSTIKMQTSGKGVLIVSYHGRRPKGERGQVTELTASNLVIMCIN
jgi:hypothetical protein